MDITLLEVVDQAEALSLDESVAIVEGNLRAVMELGSSILREGATDVVIYDHERRSKRPLRGDELISPELLVDDVDIAVYYFLRDAYKYPRGLFIRVGSTAELLSDKQTGNLWRGIAKSLLISQELGSNFPQDFVASIRCGDAPPIPAIMVQKFKDWIDQQIIRGSKACIDAYNFEPINEIVLLMKQRRDSFGSIQFWAKRLLLIDEYGTELRQRFNGNMLPLEYDFVNFISPCLGAVKVVDESTRDLLYQAALGYLTFDYKGVTIENQRELLLLQVFLVSLVDLIMLDLVRSVNPD